jgi:hypothetical protein
MGRFIKEMFIIFMGVAAFVYLIYPSLGVFELIPDALPLVGSIDEGTASLIIISVLRYYGLDVSRLFGSRFSGKQHPLIPPERGVHRVDSPSAAETVQGKPTQRQGRR